MHCSRHALAQPKPRNMCCLHVGNESLRCDKSSCLNPLGGWQGYFRQSMALLLGVGFAGTTLLRLQDGAVQLLGQELAGTNRYPVRKSTALLTDPRWPIEVRILCSIDLSESNAVVPDE